MNEQHESEVKVHANADDDPSAADLRVFFFRAVRELLLNGVKYGQDSAVSVTMSRDERKVLQVVVVDEGPGFDPALLATRDFGRGGFGRRTSVTVRLCWAESFASTARPVGARE